MRAAPATEAPVTPRLVSTWFPGDLDQYPRLARVLEYTAKLYAPTWDIRVEEALRCGVSCGRASQAAADNSWKLEHWTRAVLEAPEDCGVLLMDADTFVTAPLDPLWSIDFDLAYTVRGVARFPLNAGVMAVRANERTRRFMERWLARDRFMLKDLDYREPWRRIYGGQNQASFGSLLEGPEVADLRVVTLPCLEWNCEDVSWSRFGPGTRIVHVKSALRTTVFYVQVEPTLRPLAALWRQREGEAIRISAAQSQTHLSETKV